MGTKKTKSNKGFFETDSNGVVIKSTTNNENMYDSAIFINDIKENYFVAGKLLEKYKTYYCADAGYYTKEILEYLNENGFTAIINANKKNTKDIKKLKKLKITKYEKYIYNKRFAIENTNSNIKSFKLVQTRMDRNINSFNNTLFISYVMFIIDMYTFLYQ